MAGVGVISAAKSSACRSCRRDHQDSDRRREEREHRHRQDEQQQRHRRRTASGRRERYKSPAGAPARRAAPSRRRSAARTAASRCRTWCRRKCPSSWASTASISGASIRDEQGIEEHDAFVAADAGEIRVAVRRAQRSVHDEDTAPRRKSAAFEQRLEPLLQCLIGERRKPVEKRRNELRDSAQVKPTSRPARSTTPTATTAARRAPSA